MAPIVGYGNSDCPVIFDSFGFGSNSDSLKRYIVIQLSMAKNGSVVRDTIVRNEHAGAITNAWFTPHKIKIEFQQEGKRDTIMLASANKEATLHF